MTEQEPNELEASLSIAQINSIVKCQQHTDRILSGRHRAKEIYKKGGIPRAITFDCDTLAKKLEISHEEAELWVQVNSNIQRQVPEEERKVEALGAAKAAEKAGVEPGKITARVAKDLGVSERRAQQLLPSDLKRSYEKEEAKHDEEAANNQPRPEPQSALNPLHGNDASKYRVSTYTEAEQLFSSQLSYYSIPYRTQEAFQRDGELNSEGKPKQYFLDFYLPDKNIGIELEGEGSSSADNEDRDAFFRTNGVKLVHIPNACATRYGAVIANLLAALK